MGDKNFGYNRLRILFWCAAIALGAVDAWATRYNMNPDGISYLYEFGEPIGGTYPLWYDTSYWHEGIRPYFDLKGQLQVIKDALLVYYFTFFSQFTQLNVSVGFLMLFAIGAQRSLRLKTGAAVWPPLIVALSAFSLYSLVHVECR